MFGWLKKMKEEREQFKQEADKLQELVNKNDTFLETLSLNEKVTLFQSLAQHCVIENEAFPADTPFIGSLHDFFQHYHSVRIQDVIHISLKEHGYAGEVKDENTTKKVVQIGDDNGEAVFCFENSEGIWIDLESPVDNLFNNPDYPDIYSYLLYQIGFYTDTDLQEQSNTLPKSIFDV